MEHLHGARYPGKNGSGMIVAGGVTLGVGLLLGVALVGRGMVVRVQPYAGDRSPDLSVAILVGLGGSLAVASLGVGIPLVILGKKRQRAYRAWLEQQPLAGRAHLALGGGGLVLRF